MKRFGILVLTLTLALGSVYQAVMHLAHGQGLPGIGWMVELCIDGQAQYVALGPTGEPQSDPAHACSACVLISGGDLPALTQTAPHHPVLRDLAFRPDTRLPQLGPFLAAAPARAPPVAV